MSIFLSLTRQLLFLIPFLIIFPRFWGVPGVWASMAGSDIIAFVVAIVTLWWWMRHTMRRMEENAGVLGASAGAVTEQTGNK